MNKKLLIGAAALAGVGILYLLMKPKKCYKVFPCEVPPCPEMEVPCESTKDTKSKEIPCPNNPSKKYDPTAIYKVNPCFDVPQVPQMGGAKKCYQYTDIVGPLEVPCTGKYEYSVLDGKVTQYKVEKKCYRKVQCDSPPCYGQEVSCSDEYDYSTMVYPNEYEMYVGK